MLDVKKKTKLLEDTASYRFISGTVMWREHGRQPKVLGH